MRRTTTLHNLGVRDVRQLALFCKNSSLCLGIMKKMSSSLLISPASATGLTAAVAAAAIAVILLAPNITITNAQQQQPLISQPPAVTQNGTRLFQSTEDGIRLKVPEGWIIHDANNTGSMLAEESTQGYGILAQLCPQEEEEQQEQVGAAALVSNVSGGGSSSGVGGVDTGRCQGSEGNIIYIVRYPDLDTRLQVPNNITTTTNNNSITIDNILLYHMQKLEEVGYNETEIVDSTDASLNVTNAQTNQTIATVPAKTVEMTYSTNFAPNETRTGYFILTATNATHPNVGMTKGYSIFYEGNSTAAETTTTPSGSLVPRPLPAPVRQVFDSFELVAAVPTEPLTVEITSGDTEGGIAPATFEFEADVAGGTEPYTYSWDFGDGSSDDVAVDHTFEEAGSYNVGLTVTDSGGQSASDSMEITVEEAPAADEVEEVEDEVVEEVEEEAAAPPAAEEVEEEEDNNSGSDDLFDVDDFIDDLFDRLGLR
jgi:PKD repeat protein